MPSLNILKESGFVKLVTAGDGNIAHTRSSNVIYKARKKGFLTITLQHSWAIKKNTSPTSDYFLCWSDPIKDELNSTNQFIKEGTKIISTGSPKMIDSLIEIDTRSLAYRFGFKPDDFERIVLLATNLHWSQVSSKINIDVFDYLQKLCANYCSTMFIVKPHPSDKELESKLTSFSSRNLLYIDQNALNMIDWSINRLIKCCDGVITTFSTISADAESAGVPVAMLPHHNLENSMMSI